MVFFNKLPPPIHSCADSRLGHVKSSRQLNLAEAELLVRPIANQAARFNAIQSLACAFYIICRDIQKGGNALNNCRERIPLSL